MMASAPASAAAPRRSLWAIASLVCSLLLVPPFCMIGTVLAVIARAEIRMRPGTSGRGAANAGLALGVAATLAWGAAAAWWHVNVRRPILDGPQEALRDAFAGRWERFEDAFTAAGRGAVGGGGGGGGGGDHEEAIRFARELRRRYGDFLGSAQQETGAMPPAPPGRMVIPYTFAFERAAVPGEAEFVVSDGARLPNVHAWGWVRIIDHAEGDLVYPMDAPDAAPAPAPEPAPRDER